MQIQKAAPVDQARIYELLYKTAVWLKDKCPQQWPINWLESKKEQIFRSIQNGNFYVATQDGHLAAVMEVSYKPEAIWRFDDTPAIYIHKLAVSQTFQHLGVGAMMLSEAERMAKQQGNALIRLDCVQVNPFLKQFYLSQSFIPVGQAIDDGEAVLLFEKEVLSVL